MTPKEYIINALNDLIYIFDNVECRYRYDTLSEAHYIQILPAAIFKESKELKNYRGQILNRFYSLFENESIVFLTDDSLIKMDSVEMKFTGKAFSVLPTTICVGAYTDPIVHQYQKITADLFKHFEPNFANMLRIGMIKPSESFFYQRGFLTQGAIVCHTRLYGGESQTLNSVPNKVNTTIYRSAGESNYALFA